jgi:hypothetical protein
VSEGQDRVFRRLVPLQEGGLDKGYVWNWLNLFVLHIDLDMDLHKIVPFLVTKGG